MRNLKIKLVDYNQEEFEKTDFFKIIQKFYNIIYSESPEYIICSVFGKRYDYCNFPQIRIMISPENYIPDFNLIDYGVSSYPLLLNDRHFRHPICIGNNEYFRTFHNKSREYSDKNAMINRKFCNFIFSHDSEDNLRSRFFNELSKYKKVDSYGKLKKNIVRNVTYKDNSKTDIQREYKFSICLESTKHEGFITEKITDAFYSDTIPIFYGSNDIYEYFNEKAFINLSKYDSLNSAIEDIIRIDNDDSLYMDMLRQPILNNFFSFDNFILTYEKFVKNIFDQPIETAYRRSRVYKPYAYELFLKNPAQELTINQVISSILARIKNKF